MTVKIDNWNCFTFFHSIYVPLSNPSQINTFFSFSSRSAQASICIEWDSFTHTKLDWISKNTLMITIKKGLKGARMITDCLKSRRLSSIASIMRKKMKNGQSYIRVLILNWIFLFTILRYWMRAFRLWHLELFTISSKFSHSTESVYSWVCYSSISICSSFWNGCKLFIVCTSIT